MEGLLLPTGGHTLTMNQDNHILARSGSICMLWQAIGGKFLQLFFQWVEPFIIMIPHDHCSVG